MLFLLIILKKQKKSIAGFKIFVNFILFLRKYFSAPVFIVRDPSIFRVIHFPSPWESSVFSKGRLMFQFTPPGKGKRRQTPVTKARRRFNSLRRGRGKIADFRNLPTNKVSIHSGGGEESYGVSDVFFDAEFQFTPAGERKAVTLATVTVTLCFNSLLRGRRKIMPFSTISRELFQFTPAGEKKVRALKICIAEVCFNSLLRGRRKSDGSVLYKWDPVSIHSCGGEERQTLTDLTREAVFQFTPAGEKKVISDTKPFILNVSIHSCGGEERTLCTAQ